LKIKGGKSGLGNGEMTGKIPAGEKIPGVGKGKWPEKIPV
jgi:hypothetical protein